MSHGWPEPVRRVVFGNPMLRGIDDAGRGAIENGATLRDFPVGAAVFEDAELGDAVYVLVAGEIELRAVRRGDEDESLVRTVRPGDTFGEEALLRVGAPRRLAARTRHASRVAEIPAHLLWRGAGRSGAAALAEREERLWRRRATADLLRTMAPTRDLPEPELELLLDSVSPLSVERGERIYTAGEPASACFLVVDGLVQLQLPSDDDRVDVCAYLTRGDGFGDEEALTGQPRRLHAVALGATRLLELPATALRTLVDRNPGVVERMRRIATDRAAAQAAVVAAADERSTRHVFHDLYRMQIARSLLVIDQDSCVRCGHCATSCAQVHGVARLVRRGDKVVTSVGELGDPRSLLVVNSCQHCKNPVCMINCPTGAIGRDPGGEVFIRDALCTGCGNCAKACPWENIRMAPREGQPGPQGAQWLATKCDLCRDFSGPACVQACPTGAIERLDPGRDVAEVGALLGSRVAERNSRARPAALAWRIVPALATACAIGLGVAAVRMQQAGTLVPGRGLGLHSGVIAALGIALLLAYALPKRLPWLWLRRRPRDRRAQAAGEVGRLRTTRSRIVPLFSIHLALGVLTAAAVLGHAGLRMPATPSGSLHAAFWAVTLLGIVAAIVYRVVPRRLARIERVGALPEDLPAQREDLVDALYRQASGRSALVKKVLAEVLVPYAHAAGGSVRLLLSGRSLAREEDRLERLVKAHAPGAENERGLHDLVRTVVELRAWPIRRVLSRVLVAFVPLHVVLTGVLVALLVLHVLVMLGLP
jgi:Fe-S-cluster-containing dehydrogenase component